MPDLALVTRIFYYATPSALRIYTIQGSGDIKIVMIALIRNSVLTGSTVGEPFAIFVNIKHIYEIDDMCAKIGLGQI